MVTHVDLS